jgi:hypothetical protein
LRFIHGKASKEKLGKTLREDHMNKNEKKGKKGKPIHI